MKNGKPVYPTCGSGECPVGRKVLVQLGQGFTPAPYKQMKSNMKTTLAKIRKARAAEAAEFREMQARALRA